MPARATDILTVDNHVDGVYLYLKLLDEEPAPRCRCVEAADLERRGGLTAAASVSAASISTARSTPTSSGVIMTLAISTTSRCFSQIWSNPDEPLLQGLRDRKAHIKGRCRLCKFLDACGGSLRVRADLTCNDPWAPDPACYLTDEEIGLDDDKKKAT